MMLNTEQNNIDINITGIFSILIFFIVTAYSCEIIVGLMGTWQSLFYMHNLQDFILLSPRSVNIGISTVY